jgi:hypothetical protein
MQTVNSNLQDILYEIAENSPQKQLEGKYGVSSRKKQNEHNKNKFMTLWMSLTSIRPSPFSWLAVPHCMEWWHLTSCHYSPHLPVPENRWSIKVFCSPFQTNGYTEICIPSFLFHFQKQMKTQKFEDIIHTFQTRIPSGWKPLCSSPSTTIAQAHRVPGKDSITARL